MSTTTAMPSTFNYCSFLNKHYRLSSRIYWNILPFTTLKIASVTDSDRDTKEINTVLIKPTYKWSTELDRSLRWKMTTFAVITQINKNQSRQMYMTWYRTSIYFFFFFFCILVHQTQEFQGSYYILPYAWQTFLSFALGIILLSSPWQKWQKSPKATSL